MSNGWIGLDADSWGNIISAATGGAAVIGGIATFSITTWRDRVARRAEATDRRDAELAVQSRDAVVRVMEAAIDYLAQGREIADKPPTTRKAVNTWQKRRAQELAAIESAALLVHVRSIRSAITTGLLAIRFTPYLMVDDDWEPEQIPKRVDRIIRLIRDLAASYLRADDNEVEEAASALGAYLNSGQAARLRFVQQERDEEAARRAATRDLFSAGEGPGSAESPPA